MINLNKLKLTILVKSKIAKNKQERKESKRRDIQFNSNLVHSSQVLGD